jgi:hypothetical protein
MSTLFGSLLVAHILLGLIGVFISFAVSLMLLKRETTHRTIRYAYYACVAYVFSWFTGGYYYWFYYGTQVKPKIMGGNFAWAHAVFMEAKEHVFLFLPFASFALAVVLHYAIDCFNSEPVLKKRTAALSVAVTAVAVVITLSGVLITGSAR